MQEGGAVCRFCAREGLDRPSIVDESARNLPDHSIDQFAPTSATMRRNFSPRSAHFLLLERICRRKAGSHTFPGLAISLARTQLFPLTTTWFSEHLEGAKLGTRTASIEIALPNEARHPDVATAYKLHGSIDWQQVDAKVQKKPSSPPIALICEPSELCLATPGPMKAQMVAGHDAPLAPLWSSAVAAVENASAIVFVGYRFPPTDSFSRMRMLQAISRSGKSIPFTSCSVRPWIVLTFVGSNRFSSPRVSPTFAFGRRERKTSSEPCLENRF